MLSDLEDIDLEELECRLYSQIHHPSNPEDEPIPPNPDESAEYSVNDYNKHHYKKRYYECDIEKRPRNISKNSEIEINNVVNEMRTNNGVIEFQKENNNINVNSYNNTYSSPLRNGNSPMHQDVNTLMQQYPLPQIYAIGSSINNIVVLPPSNQNGNKRSKTRRRQKQKARKEEYQAIIRAANENAEVFKNLSFQERRKVLQYQKRQRYIERRKIRKKKEKEEKAIQEYNEQVEREIIIMDQPKTDDKIICLSDSSISDSTKVNILSSDDDDVEVIDQTAEKLYSTEDLASSDEVEDDVLYVEPEQTSIDVIDLDPEEPAPKGIETDAALMKPPSDFETMSMSSAQSVNLTPELLKPSLTSTPTKQINILTEQEKTSSTPESSNDFMDTNIVRQNNYAFSQLGSDFDPSKCAKAKKTLGEICGSESSCSTSDISMCIKNTVFNEIEFDTPSKELFTETNLQSFSEFITPRRILAQSPTENEEEINQSSDFVPTKAQKSKKLPCLSHFETNIDCDSRVDNNEESTRRSEHSTASDSSSESEYEDSKVVVIDKKQNKDEEISKKSKKQKKCTNTEEEISSPIKGKKRKSKNVDSNETQDFTVEDDSPKKNKRKKKKKKKNEDIDAETQNLIEEQENDESSVSIRKKKKKKKTQDINELLEEINSEESESIFGDANAQNQSFIEEKDPDNSLVSLKKKKRKKTQETDESTKPSEESLNTLEDVNAENESTTDRVDHDDSLVSIKKKKKKVQDIDANTSTKTFESIESEESDSNFIEAGQNENENCEVSPSKKKRKKKSQSEKPEEEDIQNDCNNTNVAENDDVKKKRKRKRRAKKNLELSDSLRNITDNDLDDINVNSQENDAEAQSKDSTNELHVNKADKPRSSLSSSSDIELIETPMKSPILVEDTEGSSIEQDFENTSPRKKGKPKKRSRNEIEFHIDPEEVKDLLNSVSDIISDVSSSHTRKRRKRKRTEPDNSLNETVVQPSNVVPQELQDVASIEEQNIGAGESRIIGEKGCKIEHENEEIENSFNKTGNDESDMSKSKQSNASVDNSGTTCEDSSSDVEIIETPAKSPIVIDDLDDELNLHTEDVSDLDLATNFLILDETNCDDEERTPQAKKHKQMDYPKRFSDYWTEDREKFHQHNWNYEHFNLPDIQKTMTSDPNKWKIIARDRLLIKSSGPRCKRCREFGHVSYYCQANVISKCNLCGGKGHGVPRCPNKICTQCGSNNKFSVTSCHKCSHLRYTICSVCDLVGHESNNCPDQWRRYHLTTEEGPIIESKSKLKLVPTQNRWCSGCARRGHFENHCKYYNRTHAPTAPSIISYKDLYGSSNNPHTRVQHNQNPHTETSSSQQQYANPSININPYAFNRSTQNTYNNFLLPNQQIPQLQQQFLGPPLLSPNPMFTVPQPNSNIFMPTYRPMNMNSAFPQPFFNICTNPGPSTSITINNHPKLSKANMELAIKSEKKIRKLIEVLHSLKKRADGYYIHSLHQSKFGSHEMNVLLYSHFGLEDGEKHMEFLLDTLDAIKREEPIVKNKINHAMDYLFYRHRPQFKYLQLLGQTMGLSTNVVFESNIRKANLFTTNIKTANYKANFLLKYKEGCLFLDMLKRRVQVLIYQNESHADIIISHMDSANVIYAEMKMNLYLARIPNIENFPTSGREIYDKLSFEMDEGIKLGLTTRCVSLYEEVVREEQLVVKQPLIRIKLESLFKKLHSIMFIKLKYSPEYYATLERWRDKLKSYRGNAEVCNEDLIEIKNAYFYIFDTKRKRIDYQKYLYVFPLSVDKNASS